MSEVAIGAALAWLAILAAIFVAAKREADRKAALLMRLTLSAAKRVAELQR